MSLSVLDWTLTGLPGWGGGTTSQEAGAHVVFGRGDTTPVARRFWGVWG